MSTVHRTIELVVPYDGEFSVLAVRDLRKLTDLLKGAPSNATLKVDARMSDGHPADTFEASWSEEIK